MLKGVRHNTTLLFSTQDPLKFRLVEMSSLHGALGTRGYDPSLGFVFLTVEYRVVHLRFVGDAVLDETETLTPENGLLALRTMGSMTMTMGDITVTQNANLLALIKVRDRAIEWARLGVSMGWPFQLLSA